MDVSLNAGLTFSPPWLGLRPTPSHSHPHQKTKSINSTFSSSSSLNTPKMLLYLDCPKYKYFLPRAGVHLPLCVKQTPSLLALILCSFRQFDHSTVYTSSMISMVTIILVMITSTALNAFFNGSQRALT